MPSIGDIPVSTARFQGVTAPTQSISSAQSMGRDIVDGGDAIKKNAVQRGAAYAATKSTEFELQAIDRMEKMKTSGTPIDRFTDDFTAAIDADITKLTKEAPDDYARIAFAERAVDMRGSLKKQAASYEHAERKALWANEAEQAVNGYANLVLQRPDEIETVQKRLEGNYAAAGAYLEPAQVAALRKNGMAAVLRAKVQGELLRGNVDVAAKLLGSDDYINGLDSDVMASLAAKVESAQKETLVANVAILPPAEQAAALKAAQGKEQYAKLYSAIESANKGRLNDPQGFAVEYGLAQPVVINLQGAELPQLLETRAETARAMKGKYGSPVKLFTEPEAKQVAEQIATMEPAQQLTALGAIQEAAGADAPEAFRQLSEKDRSLGYAAGMLTALPAQAATVQDMLAGRSMIRENPDAGKLYGTEKAARDFSATVGNAYEFWPAGEQALKDAALPLAVKRRYEKGEGEYRGDTYTRAIHDALGAEGKEAIVTFRDRKILLPAGVEEPAFKDFTESLTPGDYKNLSLSKLEPFDTKGRVFPLKALHTAQYVTVGPGRYYLKIGDGFATVPGGREPYVLQVRPDDVRAVLARPKQKVQTQLDAGGPML